jgi:hypothetical protein
VYFSGYIIAVVYISGIFGVLNIIEKTPQLCVARKTPQLCVVLSPPNSVDDPILRVFPAPTRTGWN